MLRNYLASALRNLARGRLYAAISIAGLALGLSAALILALILRNQHCYDCFLPDHERIYVPLSTLIPKQRAPDYAFETHSSVAGLMRLQFHEIEAITRLADQNVTFQRGALRVKETLYWADPNAFDILRFPLVAGDRATALRRPDGIVLSRALARKYFGRDAPLGESLRVADDHVMTVTAVIEDLPDRGTTFQSGAFASGLASWSKLTRLDTDAGKDSRKSGTFKVSVVTYLRLAPGASIERVQAGAAALMDGLWHGRPPGLDVTLTLVRLDEVHLHPGLNPGVHGQLAMALAIGLVILLIACINFVNLSTARAARRAREVMVRKVAGASRGTLVLQFLGESLISVTLAMGLAIALTECVLPSANAFLNFGARFDYWRDPTLIGWVALGTLVLAVLAGLYPAFVLSSFRPATVLREVSAHSHGTNRTRQVLVTLQFVVSITLIVASIVVYQQHVFATSEALRLSTAQHLIVRAPCRPALKSELVALPGVLGAGCMSGSFLDGAGFSTMRLIDGTQTTIGSVTLEAGVLELFGVRPLAGRLFTNADVSARDRVLINESAVRRFGFASPARAVGQVVPIADSRTDPEEIIGVVPDFALYSVEREIGPTMYGNHGGPNDVFLSLIDVKLDGRKLPETLASIQHVWRAMGASEPLQSFFLDDYVQNLYLAVLRFAQAFALMAGIAVLLACLGLVGLSASTTDRRTKEIGIRKAMGASTGAIVRLLIWQFTQPVLWGAVMAAPLSAWLMHRWLEGFAYHVALSPWPLLAAAALAVGIAVLTVSAHSYAVARAKPIAALRYE